MSRVFSSFREWVFPVTEARFDSEFPAPEEFVEIRSGSSLKVRFQGLIPADLRRAVCRGAARVRVILETPVEGSDADGD